MDNSCKRALVVLGMHRSGTSALSRGLSFLGFSQAADLMPGREDNPKGFWEAIGVVRLNDRILADLGTAWDRPALFHMPGRAPLESAAEVDAVIAKRYIEDAVTVLRTSYGEEKQIVVKDPRIALFPGLWDHALRDLGFAPRYILIFRNPLEVAASLNARNKLGRPRGQQLWMRYNLSALLLAERGLLEQVVSFEDLLARKGTAIRELGDALGISSPSSEEYERELVEFLDADGRHQVAQPETVFRTPMLAAMTKEVYRLYLDWRATPSSERNATIARLAARFEEASLLGGSLAAVTGDMMAAAERSGLSARTVPLARRETDDGGDQRTVVVHYHFFKNAGTSIDAILRKNFGSAWTQQEYEFHSRSAMADAMVSYIIEHKEISALSSHTLLFPTPQVSGIKFFPIIFIRHPLDRLKSAYVFERRQASDTPGARMAKQFDFAGYLNARLAMPGDRFCRNFQTHRLAMADAEGGSEIERALKVVERLPFVGLVEAFDDSIEQLEQLLRVHFPHFHAFQVHANNSSRRDIRMEERLAETRSELGEELFAIIESANAEDFELYACVAQRYAVAVLPTAERSSDDLEFGVSK
jgi:hypothetical protein